MQCGIECSSLMQFYSIRYPSVHKREGMGFTCLGLCNALTEKSHNKTLQSSSTVAKRQSIYYHNAKDQMQRLSPA